MRVKIGAVVMIVGLLAGSSDMFLLSLIIIAHATFDAFRGFIKSTNLD
jgi:hypothetical protein